MQKQLIAQQLLICQLKERLERVENPVVGGDRKPGQLSPLVTVHPTPGPPSITIPNSPSAPSNVSTPRLRRKPSRRSNTPRDAPVAMGSASSSTHEQFTVMSAKKKRPLKRMPKAAGISEDVTLHRNGGVVDTDTVDVNPLKGVHYTDVVTPKPRVGGIDLKSKNIKVPAITAVPGRGLTLVKPKTRKRRVDEELYGFLIYTFCLQARTPEVMQRMVAKAKQFLNDWDVTEFTHIELHSLVVEAVEAAMNIPMKEFGIRKSLQDYDANHIRQVHADMVLHGDLGVAPVKTCFPFSACLAASDAVKLPKK